MLTKKEQDAIITEDILTGHGVDYSIGRVTCWNERKRGTGLSVKEKITFSRNPFIENPDEFLAGYEYQEGVFRAASMLTGMKNA